MLKQTDILFSIFSVSFPCFVLSKDKLCPMKTQRENVLLN